MADQSGGGLKAFFRLVFDRNSGEQVKAEAHDVFKEISHDSEQVGKQTASWADRLRGNLRQLGAQGFSAIRSGITRINDVARDGVRIFAEAATTVAGYVVAITKLTEQGGKLLGVERAFAKVTGDRIAATNQLKEASHGLIGDFELMQGFNKALTLGAADNIEQFAEFADVAVSLSRALGVDAAVALENLTLGIGKQQDRMLSSIGILIDTEQVYKDYADAIGKTVEQLNEQEKAEAFRIATLEKAHAKVAELGEIQETAADSTTRWKIAVGNLRDEFAKWLAESEDLKIAFAEAANIAETLVMALETRDLEIIKEAFRLAGWTAGSIFAAALLDAISATFRGISDLITPKFMEDHAQWIPILGVFKSISDFAKQGADAAWVTADANVEALGALRGSLEAKQELASREAESLAFQGPLQQAAQARVEIQDEEIERLVKGHELHQLTLLEMMRALEIQKELKGRLDEGNLSLAERVRLGTQLAAIKPLADEMTPKPFFPKPTIDPERQRNISPVPVMSLDLFEERWRHDNELFVQIAEEAAVGVERAWARAFDALLIQGRGVAGFFNGLFSGIAQAGFGALSSYASEQVKINLAEAVTQFARGLGWTFLNPAAAVTSEASASQHLVAAGMWAAIAGGSSSAGHAIGGSGGGGHGGRVSGAPRGGDDPLGRPGDRGPRDSLVIHIDGMDPTNPRHQKLLGHTLAEHERRTGNKITVKTA